MTENVSSASVCSADKPKKVRRPMPLAHVWPSHRSPSGSGERKLEAMPSSGNAHSLSSCERCYFLNFRAEILHAFPNQPHAKLQPLFSWEHHISGCCGLLLIAGEPHRNGLHFLMGKMSMIKESHRIILSLLFFWLCWALAVTCKAFPCGIRTPESTGSAAAAQAL